MRQSALLTLFLLALGCQPASKLAGTWKGTVGFASVELTFDPGGGYQSTVGAGTSGGVAVTGHYKADGNSVTLTPEKVSLPPGAPEANAEVLKRPSRYTITWSGEKSLRLANSKESMDLTKS
ncbi:MAG: hypothetical protein JSS66_16455 [Armatimonadetes bacterium]|nr:hypothetical protein [Armatimonadota bacterium]